MFKTCWRHPVSNIAGWNFGFVSDFGVRISGLLLLSLFYSAAPAAWADSNPPLQALLAQGGRIQLTTNATYSFSNSIPITNQVTLDAAGFNVTLTGNNISRLFVVEPGASLTLSGLLITGGRSTNGGAVYIYPGGTALLTNCTLAGNVANTLIIAGSQVVTNEVITTNTTGVTTNTLVSTNTIISTNFIGSGVFFVTNEVVTTNVLVTGADSFTTNLVVTTNAPLSVAGADGADGADSSYGTGQNGGGGRAGRPCWGGAIYNRGNLQVLDCTLVTNTAIGGDGGNGGNGGSGRYRGGNGGGGGKGNSGFGGAIYNDKTGTVFLQNCTLNANQATGGNGGTGGTAGGGPFGGTQGSGGAGGPAEGAGLYSLGRATMLDCTFSDNQVTGGNSATGGTEANGEGVTGPRGGSALGGAFCTDGVSAVTNCTFYANNALGGDAGDGGPGRYRAGNGGAGGPGTGGAIYSLKTTYLINCTIWQNGAEGGTNGVAGSGVFGGNNGAPGQGHGGGLARAGGTLLVANSIIGGSTAGRDVSGAVKDAGYNLWSDSSVRPARRSTSHNNTNPDLGPFGFYGGLTPTLPLLTNSPARDKIPPAAAPATDQRGIPRPINFLSDIGAFEFDAAGPPIKIQSPISLTVTQFTSTALSVTVLGGGPLDFQWFEGNQLAMELYTNVSGIVTNSLLFTNVLPGQAGYYFAIITNSLGAATSSVAHLTVESFPAFGFQPQSLTNLLGTDAVFIATNTATPPSSFQWQFNGTNVAGGTSTNFQTAFSLLVTNVRASEAGSYQLVVSNAYGTSLSSNAVLYVLPVLAWGDDSLGQTNVPITATNVLAIASGDFHTLALRSDGTVVAWGAGLTNSGSSQTNGDVQLGQSLVPAGLGNVTNIAAGSYHSLALRNDGSIQGWGDNSFGQTQPPAMASNCVAMAAGLRHSLALRSDGTVIGWGSNGSGQSSPPSTLPSNIIALAAGYYHSLALSADGLVFVWGSDSEGQSEVPAGLTNVGAIAAAGYYSLALKTDGTVAAWGDNTFGQTNVPANATNVIAIAAGFDHALALRRDGSVALWGDTNSFGLGSVPSQVRNAVGVSAGKQFGAVLVGGGAPLILTQPVGITTNQGGTASLSVTVLSPSPVSYQWLMDGTNLPGETSSTLMLTNLSATDAGTYSVVALNFLGSTTSSGASLVVRTWPVIQSVQPTNYLAVATHQQGVSFTVVATGWSLSYQWLSNSVALPGQTNAVLSFEDPQPAYSATYMIVVSNFLDIARTVTTNCQLSVTNLAGPSVSTPALPAVGSSGGSGSGALAIRIAPPAVLLGSPTGGTGTFGFSFASQTGSTYVVEFKNNLAETNWTALGKPVPGTGGWMTNSDSMSNHPARFYRLRVRPGS